MSDAVDTTDGWRDRGKQLRRLGVGASFLAYRAAGPAVRQPAEHPKTAAAKIVLATPECVPLL
jgi:hypothetical protein